MGVLDSWEFFWRAGSRTYCLCVSAVWSAGPVRVYLGRFAGLGGVPVRIFCLLGSVLACVCVIEQVGGVAGQYDFSSIL